MQTILYIIGEATRGESNYGGTPSTQLETDRRAAEVVLRVRLELVRAPVLHVRGDGRPARVAADLAGGAAADAGSEVASLPRASLAAYVAELKEKAREEAAEMERSIRKQQRSAIEAFQGALRGLMGATLTSATTWRSRVLGGLHMGFERNAPEILPADNFSASD